jgi:hypothetical protein
MGSFMANKPHHTLADYIVIALSPALILVLVCSLVFFLLDLLYSGAYIGRMQWILFFFILATVGIARISMETYISQRAGLYGLVLAGVTWPSIMLYVDFPPDHPLASINWLVSLGFIALIWWCAHRLTWDCTYIDDKVEASGEGLLQAAGLDKGQASQPTADEDETETAELTWWERYQRYRERRKRKHSPGTWVIYFSLAALPLFGLGQALIPVEDVDRRNHSFWLMVLYMASGLGLLLTTCFLGLRRYLRQRRLQMPTAMAGTWLMVGGGLIAILVVASAVLPRPQSETPLVDISSLTGERSASQYATMDGKAGKGEGRPGGEAPDEKKDDSDSGGDKGEQEGKGQGPSDAQGSQGNSGKKGGGSNNQQSQSTSNQQGKQDQGDDSKGQGQTDKSQNDKSQKDPSQRNSNQQNSSQQAQGERNKDEQRSSTGSTSSSNNPRPGKRNTRSSSPPVPALQFLGKMGPILKWIVFGVLAVGVVVVLFRSGLGWLANFFSWARNLLDALRSLWERLFGGGSSQKEAEQPAVATSFASPRPFSAFRNPFDDGSATRRSPQELVRYSFAALQAWAWERALGRAPEETPLEFAARIGAELPTLEADTQRLAILYARVAYARGSLPANSVPAVEKFWQQLEAVVEQPLSA